MITPGSEPVPPQPPGAEEAFAVLAFLASAGFLLWLALNVYRAVDHSNLNCLGPP
jgi:hypothetical protein